MDTWSRASTCHEPGKLKNVCSLVYNSFLLPLVSKKAIFAPEKRMQHVPHDWPEAYIVDSLHEVLPLDHWEHPLVIVAAGWGKWVAKPLRSWRAKDRSTVIDHNWSRKTKLVSFICICKLLKGWGSPKSFTSLSNWSKFTCCNTNLFPAIINEI